MDVLLECECVGCVCVCVWLQVIRGLRRERGGLVATQRQFEFLHLALEEMTLPGATGGEEGEGEEETDSGRKPSWKKTKKAKGSSSLCCWEKHPQTECD